MESSRPEEREKAGKPRAGSVTLLFANVGGRSWSASATTDAESIWNRYAKGQEKEPVRASGIGLFRVGDSGVLSSAWFSTREAANEYSGRGVGARRGARQMVETFGGHLHLESTRGKAADLCICL